LESMRTEDLKNIILKMFGHKKFYGYEIHKKLASKKIKIEISRLYRVLNEMMKDKMLKGKWEKSPLGPRKKVYSLDSIGREKLDKMLMDAIKTIHSYYGKYLEALPSAVNPISIICNILTNKLKDQVNIAYVASKYSGMHERMIRELHNQRPQGTIHFIKPSSMQIELNLDSLLSLKGSYDDIPMKDGYFDLLLAIDFPEREGLKAMLQESHRVIKQNGTLAILTPTALIHKHMDPMTIGDFVEKFEHETTENNERIDYKLLQGLLKDYYKQIKERKIVHISLFLATEPRHAE
ncbi:helix-turn-helix transcriptional regulator, partial [Candidatus Bathyarchaeota archaeon]|nr:helix-turn-helix transcriptional regulator [Candidatus Bathyarchaeota archaeon]